MIRLLNVSVALLLFTVHDTYLLLPVHAQEIASPPDLRNRKDGEDWPAFLGSRGDSVSTETGILLDWKSRPPRVVWQKELGMSYGNCTVSRGRCFQFDRVEASNPTSRLANVGRLRCFESETGKLLWTYTYDYLYADYYGYNKGPRCSPIVDGHRVFIYGPAGQLHCVNTTTGKKIWSEDLNEAYGVVQNFFGVGSNPIVYGENILVMVGGSPADTPVDPGGLNNIEGNGSCVVALDKATGKEKYKCSNDLASYASLRVAKIDGRDWGFAFARKGLVGFDPANGKERFQFPWRAKTLESVNASCPLVIGNEVLISETYGPGAALLTISGDKYSVKWQDDARKRAKSLQTHWNTPVYHAGYVYGSSGRHDSNAELRCIELKTGKVMWSEPGLLRCSILLVDGHLLTQSEDGTLLLVKATAEKFELVSKLVLPDKERLNQFSGEPNPLLREPAWAAPVLSHGLLYVRGNDRLVCLELIPAVK